MSQTFQDQCIRVSPLAKGASDRQGLPMAFCRTSWIRDQLFDNTFCHQRQCWSSSMLASPILWKRCPNCETFAPQIMVIGYPQCRGIQAATGQAFIWSCLNCAANSATCLQGRSGIRPEVLQHCKPRVPRVSCSDEGILFNFKRCLWRCGTFEQVPGVDRPPLSLLR